MAPPPTSDPAPPRSGGRLARARHVAGLLLAQGPAEPFRRFLFRRGLRRRLAVHVSGPTRPFSRVHRNAPRPPENAVASRLRAEDLDDYLAFRPDESREAIERRLADGHAGLIVRVDGELQGHSWLGVGRVPISYLGATMHLEPNVAFVYDDFVAPAFRNRHLLRAASPLRREVQAELGVDRHVSLLLPENELAFQRIARHRPVFSAEVGRLALGPWRRLYLRLDREIVGPRGLPLRFEDGAGRPPRVRRVDGPLFLDRSPWATPRNDPPGFPGSRLLDAAGVLERRLVTVFPSDARLGDTCRIPMEVERLEPAGIEAYLALRPDQRREAVAARLRAGHVAFVARSRGRLIAAAWLAPAGGVLEALGCELRLAPDAAGVYDDFVAPRWRRLRALDALDDARSEHALQAGWKRCVGLVPPEVPGAWVRARRTARPIVAELRRTGIGPLARATLRLRPGFEPGDLGCVPFDGGRALARQASGLEAGPAASP